jgi:hypothetical protein
LYPPHKILDSDLEMVLAVGNTMNTNLTWRLEERLIARARVWATQAPGLLVSNPRESAPENPSVVASASDDDGEDARVERAL